MRNTRRNLLLPGLALSLTLSSSFVFAAQPGYELKVEFTLNGKVVSSPRIQTLPDEKYSVVEKNGDQETFIDVVASEGLGEINGNKAILMKFAVGVIENGERKVLAQPQIMTIEKNKAVIAITQGDSQEHVGVSVEAQRKNF